MSGGRSHAVAPRLFAGVVGMLSRNYLSEDSAKTISRLGERRREIDRRFDYRYSVLPLVFAGLLRDGRLVEDDLRGLAPDKLEAIRQLARF
jgi:hypothetical protein